MGAPCFCNTTVPANVDRNKKVATETKNKKRPADSFLVIHLTTYRFNGSAFLRHMVKVKQFTF